MLSWGLPVAVVVGPVAGGVTESTESTKPRSAV